MRERDNRLIRAGSVIAAGVVWASLLMGCAHQSEPLQTETSRTLATDSAGRRTAGYTPEAVPLQSSTERQLVIVFISLLEMDKRVELRISPQQAKLLLPVVNRSIEQGELSSAFRKQLLEALNGPQMGYYEEVSAAIKKRAAAMERGPGPPPGPPMSPEERDALAKELDARRSQGEPSVSPEPAPPPRFGETSPWDTDLDKSIEQQLVELLQSKLDVSETPSH